ncbi:MAG: hypothetical protein ACO1SV_08560 [Fimbriimonas sp.]
MHESDFRNRIDFALWSLMRGLGIDVVYVDSAGGVGIDPSLARDVHMIRSMWPAPDEKASPDRDVFCARTLLARCESKTLRDIPPGHLANAIRNALERH